MFAFLKEELNGETVGGKVGTCRDKNIIKMGDLSVISIQSIYFNKMKAKTKMRGFPYY